ncbi:MAG TPA: hypothetical protein VG755_09805 [Nannocystaceae bacterium]|nr:hypothetical protein [Nannocystaceae bacterium]
MIEYALLCQTIADWRAGRRPVLPPSSSPTLQPSGGTAPIVLTPTDEEDAEVIDAGEADIDDAMVAESDEADVPVDDGYGDAPHDAPPPDYDSTMVYGANGQMPGQWPAEGAPQDEEPEPAR